MTVSVPKEDVVRVFVRQDLWEGRVSESFRQCDQRMLDLTRAQLYPKVAKNKSPWILLKRVTL